MLDQTRKVGFRWYCGPVPVDVVYVQWNVDVQVLVLGNSLLEFAFFYIASLRCPTVVLVEKVDAALLCADI